MDENRDLQNECRRLLDTRLSLQLATVDGDGRPHASYAPFVPSENDFYVYVSQLSAHTRNLLDTQRAGVLVIEDEGEAENPFVRRRLVFDCRATTIARDTPVWGEILDRFEQRFGDIVLTLRELRDFVLFRLRAESGVYVRGFGQAYRLEGEKLDRLHHIVPRRR